MKYRLALIVVFLSSIASAQEPTMNEIRNLATTFINEKAARLSLLQKSTQDIRIENISKISRDGVGICNLVELLPGGFVILSNNKALDPVIAYSMNSDYKLYQDTSNVLYQLIVKDISQRTAYLNDGINKWVLSETSYKAAEEDQQWPDLGTSATGGWIETTWNQSYPYNKLFPIDPLTGDRVITGCVTTALAQVLHYHGTVGEYPLDYRAAYTSQGQNNTIIQIDGDYQTGDFSSFSELNDILTTVKSKYEQGTSLSETEISAVNFLAAIMVKANFTSFSTSANIGNISRRLLDFFRYGSSEISSNVSAEVFSNLISNMRLARPALLSIQKDEGSGHLIICDGYNTDNFFHLNFGWGANAPEAISEVWYNIPQDIPANYSLLSSVIYNINPEPVEVDIAESLVELFPLGELKTSSIHLNASVNLTIDLSNESFLLSENGTDFSGNLSNVDIAAGQEKEIWIKYEPEASMTRDFLELSINNKAVEYVELRGYPSGNVIDPGSISGVWDDKEKPYLISGDIYVDSNNKLLIKEGVRVYFMNETGLTINDGILEVKGSPQYPVTFTTLSNESYWDGLNFINSGNDDQLEYATILNSNSSGIEAVNTDLIITNCMLSNNQSNRGGGISLIGSNTTLSGCIVVNNSYETWGETYGGGLYAENSNVSIINCTFSKNTSLMGGAIFATGSELELINSIIWDNRSWPQKGQTDIILHKEIAFNTLNTTVRATSCIIRDLESLDPYGQPLGLASLIQARNVLDQNPGFQKSSSSYGPIPNPLINDWRISRYSVAVNNGNKEEASNLPNIDIYGNPRIFLGELDMGAAEFIDSCRLLTISPLSNLNFPTTMIGESSSAQIQVKNSGVGAVNISTGMSGAGYFTADRTFEKEVLLPGESLTLNISYSPESSNQCDTGYIVLYTSAENYEYEKIRLSGASAEGQLVQGELSGVWTREGGPYIVNRDSWVKADGSLTIEKGTEVYVSGSYSISVSDNASIRINGTVGDSVKIMGMKDWKGISFEHCTQTQLIQYLSISGVKNHPALIALESPILVYNSNFEDNDQCILILNQQSNGHMHDIRNCSFQSNIRNIISYINVEESQSGIRDTLLFVGNHFKQNDVSSVFKTRSLTAPKLVLDENVFCLNNVSDKLIDHLLLEGSLSETKNSIHGNQIYNNTGTGLLGISSQNDQVSICNNLIVQNSSTNNWEGIFNLAGSDIEILNNTVAYNEVQTNFLKANTYTRAGQPDDKILIRNNIFRSNSNSDFTFYGYHPTILTDYNVIENQYAGADHNLNIDPGFAGITGGTIPGSAFSESDWYLAPSSPCIDAGHPDVYYRDKSDPENPGDGLFPSQGTFLNDIGAFGGNYANDFVFEAATICEGLDYKGRYTEGVYYEVFVTENGRDSIILLNLEVIESELVFSNPSPQVGAVMSEGQIDFSWECSPPGGDSLQFRLFYSTDNYFWNEVDAGNATNIQTYLSGDLNSSQKVYWYVINSNGNCPRFSPEWEFTIDFVTDAESPPIDGALYSVFPNPGNGRFTFQLHSDLKENLTLKLYDVSGQMIWGNSTMDPGKMGRVEFDVSDRGKGIYILTGSTGRETFSEKIIVH